MSKTTTMAEEKSGGLNSEPRPGSSKEEKSGGLNSEPRPGSSKASVDEEGSGGQCGKAASVKGKRGRDESIHGRSVDYDPSKDPYVLLSDNSDDEDLLPPGMRMSRSDWSDYEVLKIEKDLRHFPRNSETGQLIKE